MGDKLTPMAAVMRQVNANKKNLLGGRVLSIDPGSVKFGWAYYEQGKLVASGQEHIKHRWPHHRLKILASICAGLPEADVLVTEKIAAWNSKTVASSYITLLKSIGVIVGNCSWKYCLEISPSMWQNVASERWSKGTDENDAITIGEVVIGLAHGKESQDQEESQDGYREEGAQVSGSDIVRLDAVRRPKQRKQGVSRKKAGKKCKTKR